MRSLQLLVLLAGLCVGAEPVVAKVPVQSVGHPRRGRLRKPARLERGPNHVFRNRVASFGTSSMVGHLGHILRGLQDVPHPLVVGDLSARHGGPLRGHRSHQSGRDVDLGMFYGHDPGRRFIPATADNLDPAATWGLLLALASTRGEPGGVEWILLDYEVQGVIYDWALGSGEDPSVVSSVLQYPHGRDAQRGLVRHFARHRHHLHVRFACPPEQGHCRSPEGPPHRAARTD